MERDWDLRLNQGERKASAFRCCERMNEVDIDAVVREVVRRLVLATTASAVAPSSQSSASDVECVSISEKVVTLGLLEGRLTTAKRLLVRRQAIVTPAVRDELKKRSIRLEFVDQKAACPASSQWLLAMDNAVPTTTSGWETLGAGEQLKSTNRQTLAEFLRELAFRILSERKLGVLISPRPAAAACLANRRPGIRAALGCDARQVSEAMKNLSPNLLVLDSQNKSIFSHKALLAEFLRGGWRECPAELKNEL